MHPGDAHVVWLDGEAGQDCLHADGARLAVRGIRALYADQEFHRGNRRDGGIVKAEDRIHVEPAALDRDEDAGVEDYSPGHPRTSSLKADRSSSCTRSRSSANPASAGLSRRAALSRSADVRRSGTSRPTGTPSRVITTVSPCSTASRMLAKLRAACVAVTAIMNTHYQISSAYAYTDGRRLTLTGSWPAKP